MPGTTARLDPLAGGQRCDENAPFALRHDRWVIERNNAQRPASGRQGTFRLGYSLRYTGSKYEPDHLLLDITPKRRYADWWTLAASKRSATGSRAVIDHRSLAVSAAVSALFLEMGTWSGPKGKLKNAFLAEESARLMGPRASRRSPCAYNIPLKRR